LFVAVVARLGGEPGGPAAPREDDGEDDDGDPVGEDDVGEAAAVDVLAGEGVFVEDGVDAVAEAEAVAVDGGREGAVPRGVLGGRGAAEDGSGLVGDGEIVVEDDLTVGGGEARAEKRRLDVGEVEVEQERDEEQGEREGRREAAHGYGPR
jgi:hypothetical protein